VAVVEDLIAVVAVAASQEQEEANTPTLKGVYKFYLSLLNQFLIPL